jgi:hypothetical protein
LPPGISITSERPCNQSKLTSAVFGLEIAVLGKERGHFGLNGFGEQATRPIAKHFGERIAKRCWLNQLDNIIVGHGVSSFEAIRDLADAVKIQGAQSSRARRPPSGVAKWFWRWVLKRYP